MVTEPEGLALMVRAPGNSEHPAKAKAANTKRKREYFMQHS